MHNQAIYIEHAEALAAALEAAGLVQINLDNDSFARQGEGADYETGFPALAIRYLDGEPQTLSGRGQKITQEVEFKLATNILEDTRLKLAEGLAFANNANLPGFSMQATIFNTLHGVDLPLSKGFERVGVVGHQFRGRLLITTSRYRFRYEECAAN